MPRTRTRQKTTELVSAEIEAFLDSVRTRRASHWGVVVDDDGNGHLYGGFGRAFANGTLNGDRAALNYTKQDVDAFRRLAARAYGWPGHRLHLNERTIVKGKERWQTCWCATCAPIRRSLKEYVTEIEAEEMLAIALTSAEPWFLPASGRERQRVYGARNNERGKCQRCPNPARPNRATCQACADQAKAAVYAARIRARESRQKAS